MHALITTDPYQADNISKNSLGYSLTLAEPRNFTVGLSYDFGTLLKKN